MIRPAPRNLLHELFSTAIAAAEPGRHVAGHLPPRPVGRVVVVGAGKASAAMAAALEAAWPDADLAGCVAVPPGSPPVCRRIQLLEAAHPVPDERSVEAARRMRHLVTGLSPDDLVIALISGGGSALLCEPAEGVSLDRKQALTNALLRCGAGIREINCVRQCLSRIKGGRLAAAAAPARVATLIVSDVPGDDPALIASGPTVASPFSPADAEAVLERYNIETDGTVIEAIRRSAPPRPETLAERCNHTIVCSGMQSLEAAAAQVRDWGLEAVLLGDGLEGEARTMGTIHAGLATSIARWRQPVAPPSVLLSGGESSVTLGETDGRGGRNSEFLLALALALNGRDGIHAIAGDTDGIDGSEDNAGALIDPTSLARARALDIDPHQALADHDAYGFFEALGDLVDTGPTGTNVNDFRAILIE